MISPEYEGHIGVHRGFEGCFSNSLYPSVGLPQISDIGIGVRRDFKRLCSKIAKVCYAMPERLQCITQARRAQRIRPH